MCIPLNQFQLLYYLLVRLLVIDLKYITRIFNIYFFFDVHKCIVCYIWSNASFYIKCTVSNQLSVIFEAMKYSIYKVQSQINCLLNLKQCKLLYTNSQSQINWMFYPKQCKILYTRSQSRINCLLYLNQLFIISERIICYIHTHLSDSSQHASLSFLLGIPFVGNVRVNNPHW